MIQEDYLRQIASRSDLRLTQLKRCTIDNIIEFLEFVDSRQHVHYVEFVPVVSKQGISTLENYYINGRLVKQANYKDCIFEV